MPNTLLNLDNNPVRRARLKMGLSLTAAALAARVNYQTWYTTECGCYAAIPPGLLEFLENEGFNVLHLENEYEDFVAETRDEFYAEFSPLYGSIEFTGLENPVTELRQTFGLSRTAFAKQLCVQPAVLYKVESGTSKGLPQQLRAALVEVAIPEVILDKLEGEVGLWQR